MDIIKEKKKGWRRLLTKQAVPYLLIVCALSLFGYAIWLSQDSKLRVNKERLSVREVREDWFNDYIRLNGQVLPMVTVQLSPLEAGVVRELFVEEGAQVKAGDPILQLSNENLDMQILNSEADLAEKENILRNTMISMEQQRLNVEQECLQYAVEVKRRQREYESKKALYADQLIAKEDFLRAQEDYELAQGRLKLVRERAKQDSLYRSVEIGQMRESLDNMRLNMQMIRQRKNNLVLRAPIDGELGLLSVSLGESVAAGSKMGQINDMSKYKIEAFLDEHYIDRVSPGLEAKFERQEASFSAIIRKIYPEVRNGKFRADFQFKGDLPKNIRSGQTYYLNLQLGQPEKGILIPRGSFYQKTGGKWIYVVNADGTKAFKRNIRIGRQNPQYFEVLEGLEAGERVITSTYDELGEYDVLVLE